MIDQLPTCNNFVEVHEKRQMSCASRRAFLEKCPALSLISLPHGVCRPSLLDGQCGTLAGLILVLLAEQIGFELTL